MHPSELFAAGTPAAKGRVGPTRRARHRRLPAAAVGAAAAVAAVGGFLLAASVQGPAQRAATTSVTLPAATAAAMARHAPGLAKSLVVLTVAGPTGDRRRCGVAVAPGGLVATDAFGLAGTRIVSAETGGGASVTAVVVAEDKGSDIALVHVDRSLPVPRFADDSALRAGVPVAALALDPQAASRPRPWWSPDVVEGVAVAIPQGMARGLGAITALGIAPPPGSVLLDDHQRVVGLDDGEGQGVFLPSELVLGVARQLAADGQVHHGWLGLTGWSRRGAVVATVSPGGPSAGRLEPGDVIVAVDGTSVRSLAELRERLYVLAPATTARLGVLRHGIELHVDVALGASP